jgi:hypothetical protein
VIHIRTGVHPHHATQESFERGKSPKEGEYGRHLRRLRCCVFVGTFNLVEEWVHIGLFAGFSPVTCLYGLTRCFPVVLAERG